MSDCCLLGDLEVPAARAALDRGVDSSAAPAAAAATAAPKLLTRIFVDESGDLIVTDLWQDLRKDLLSSERGFCEA